MKQLFIKWREEIIPINKEIEQGVSKRGHYNLNHSFVPSRQWYVDNAGLIVYDTMLDSKYTDGPANDPRKGRLFAVVEYDETVLTVEDLTFDLQNNTPDVMSVNVLTPAEAKYFLDNYTTCTKVDNGNGTFTYILREEVTNPITQVTIPAYTITL